MLKNKKWSSIFSISSTRQTKEIEKLKEENSILRIGLQKIETETACYGSSLLYIMAVETLEKADLVKGRPE